MTTWLHTAILATSLAATIAIGLASAAVYEGVPAAAAPKTDKLVVAATSDRFAAAGFVTVETRGKGVSVLNRIPVSETN